MTLMFYLYKHRHSFLFYLTVAFCCSDDIVTANRAMNAIYDDCCYFI